MIENRSWRKKKIIENSFALKLRVNRYAINKILNIR